MANKRSRWKRKRGQGRKPKDLPRTPSGRLSRSSERRVIERAAAATDRATALAERARGLGLSEQQAADPLSETIAGRMALRGLLNRGQAEAIDEYAKLVRAAGVAMCAPAGVRCSLSLVRAGDGPDDPERYALAMRRYNDAFGCVFDVGYRTCRAISCVVRDQLEPPTSERAFVKPGAEALRKHFGFASGRRVAPKAKAA